MCGALRACRRSARGHSRAMLTAASVAAARQEARRRLRAVRPASCVRVFQQSARSQRLWPGLEGRLEAAPRAPRRRGGARPSYVTSAAGHPGPLTRGRPRLSTLTCLPLLLSHGFSILCPHAEFSFWCGDVGLRAAVILPLNTGCPEPPPNPGQGFCSQSALLPHCPESAPLSSSGPTWLRPAQGPPPI